MAITATDICNLGLLDVPAPPISSLDEGSPVADALKAAYPWLKQELLEKSAWTFATKRVTLAEAANDRPAEWGYALAKPEDAGMILRLIASAPTTFPDVATEGQIMVRSRGFGMEGNIDARAFTERYELGNGLLYCDVSPVLCEYVDISTDETFFPMEFAHALGLYVAAKCIKQIGRDEAIQNSLLQKVEVMVQRAMANDLNKQQRQHNAIPDVYTSIW
jgi:hypothetical protein